MPSAGIPNEREEKAVSRRVSMVEEDNLQENIKRREKTLIKRTSALQI